MNRYGSILASVFFTFVVCLSGFAQDDSAKIITGGVINGKAVNLVKPEYPAAAKAAGASGAVNVEVILDEEGNVTTAKAISGHELLRKNSEEAALASKFSPTKLSGQPVKVKGIIVYNFVSGKGSATDNKEFVTAKILNSKALSLPKPEYPSAAKAVKAEGTVMVEVIVDEQGEVISAVAVSGHELLRKAAMTAASKAKFSPTKLKGRFVKVKGIVVYNFVAN
jgi:TonB family protein